VSGGKERLMHYWSQRHPEVRDVDGAGVRDTIARLHELKTAAYEAMVNDGAVSLRPGVLHLIDAAGHAGLHLAIATTTSPVNIAALLRGAIGSDWRQFFGIVEDASTAANKKPHPQVYLQTLQRLQLPAGQCLAFEDSANGLRAAIGAGLATVITPTQFTADHDFSGALKVLPNLQGVTVADLQAWHAKPTA
jgi:HAD superfamily hydrolase (TIGR01509 family)